MAWKKIGALDAPSGAGPLTATEFKVLQLMLSEPGRPVSRHYLLAQVWGLVVPDREDPAQRSRPEPSNAEVAISALRRRWPGLIETAPTRGTGWLIPKRTARRCRLILYPEPKDPAWALRP